MLIDPTEPAFLTHPSSDTSVASFVRHGKNYPDGSVIYTLRLEDQQNLRRPLHVKLLAYQDEIVLFQAIEAIPPTQKLPTVHITEEKGEHHHAA